MFFNKIWINIKHAFFGILIHRWPSYCPILIRKTVSKQAIESERTMVCLSLTFIFLWDADRGYRRTLLQSGVLRIFTKHVIIILGVGDKKTNLIKV